MFDANFLFFKKQDKMIDRPKSNCFQILIPEA